MSKVIEDELTRTREFREECLKQAEGLKRLGAPQILIDEEIRKSKLTRIEYENEVKAERAAANARIKEFQKNNPMRESVVKGIFKWFDENMHTCTWTDLHMGQEDHGPMPGWDCLWQKMDLYGPHIGMTEDEFKYGVYDQLIAGICKQEEEKRNDESIRRH